MDSLIRVEYRDARLPRSRRHDSTGHDRPTSSVRRLAVFNQRPRLGYHTLTALLISFVTMYTWAALA